MNNFNLPTIGDTNWGVALNAYLENLNLRMSKLESYHISGGINSVIRNIGYASSGVVGSNSKWFYNTEDKKIVFEGSVFISGDINTYYEGLNVDLALDESTRNNDKSYYVLLKYNSGDDFEILLTQEIQLDYSVILLGFYRNEHLVQYGFSCLKTIAQHMQEMKDRWIDMDTNQCLFNVTTSASSVTATLSGSYNYYCPNLFYSADGKYENNSKYYANKDNNHYTITPKNNIIYIQDFKNVDNTIKLNSISSSSLQLTSKGNYFRILLDVFGNIIIQKSVEDTPFDGDHAWCNQQLYNAKFCNDFTLKSDEGTLVDSLEPNFITEVARFGCNNIIEAAYEQGSLNTSTLIYFVKSNNKIPAQNSHNVWLTEDSELWLDHILLKNDYSCKNQFMFTYDTNDYSETLIIDDVRTWIEEYPDLISEESINTLIRFKENVTRLQFFHDDETEPFFLYRVGDPDATLEDLQISTINNTIAVDFYMTSGQVVVESVFTAKVDRDSSINSMVGDILFKRSEGDIEFRGDSFSASYEDTKIGSENIELDATTSLSIQSEGLCTISGLHGVLKLNSTSTESAFLKINQNSSGKTAELKLNININTDDSNKPEGCLYVKYDGNESGVIIKPSSKTVEVDADTLLTKNIQLKEGCDIFITSDRRRKECFSEITESYLDVVVNTPVLNYYYKNSDKIQIGIIAQDLESSIKNNIQCFVNIGETNEFKDKRTVSENKLIYILWKALQEETELRQKLEKRLTRLERDQ